MDGLVLMETTSKVVLIIIILYPGTQSSEEPECEAPKFLDKCFLEMPHRNVNGTVTYHCDKGYWFTGTKRRVCQKNLTWSGNPGVCTEVLCPPLSNPPHGRIEVTGKKFKDKALVICDEGYIFSRRQYNPGICQENNTWTFEDGVCKKIRCPDLPDLPHGRIVYRRDGHKAAATMTCDEGYRYSLPESVTRRCQANSTWSSQRGVCEEVRCPDIENVPPLGKIVYDGYSYKARATVKCDIGYFYTKPESMTRTCQGDNTWSLQFDGKCIEIPTFCPSIPNVDNAIAFSNGLHYRSTITYKCEDGYKQTGLRTISCETTRQWSTLSMRCVRNNQTKSKLWIVILLIVIIVIIIVIIGLTLWLYRKRGKCWCLHHYGQRRRSGQHEACDKQPLTRPPSGSSDLAHLQSRVEQFVDKNKNSLIACQQQVVITDHCVIVPRTTDT